MPGFMTLTEFNQSDRCEHFSCPEISVSPAVYILLYVCSAAVILLTVCGNLLVIISVFHFKQLHTRTNTLVLSLTMSDFLVGAFVMPPMLSWTIESCWIFGRGFCICFLLIGGFLIILSIYNVALVAVDRYLALSNPFLYTSTISRRTMCIVIYSNWSLSLLYNTAVFYFNGSFTGSVICPGECYVFLNDVLSVIDLIYSFIFPCSVIIIFYTLVFVIAKKHAIAIRELNNHRRPKTHKKYSHTEKKAAKVLCILVSVFLVCLLPYFIYSVLGNVIELQTKTLHIVFIIFYLNSTINPFIYALFYPWFRRCVKIIITLQILHPDSALMNVLS